MNFYAILSIFLGLGFIGSLIVIFSIVDDAKNPEQKPSLHEKHPI